MANPSFVYIPPSNTGLPGGIPTANTVEYFEKGIDEQGPYYLVQYYILNWQQSDIFINALLGYSTTSGLGSGGVVKRSPHQYPLSPGLLCRRARCIAPGQPKIGPSGLPDFSGGALIQAEYRSPQWQSSINNVQEQIDPNTAIPFCTQELDHTTETYTLPGTKMFYDTTTRSTDQPFRIRVPVTNMSLTFHLSPNLYVATGTIRAVRGCVNSTTFMGASAGTVLFRGCRTVRNYDSVGNVVQEIQLTFSERDPNQLWNALPDKDNPTLLPWPLVRGGNGTTGALAYPIADFNQYIFGF